MVDRKNRNDTYTVGRNINSSVFKPVDMSEAGPITAIDPPAKAKRRTWKRWPVLFIVLLVIPILTVSIWDIQNYSRASQKLFGTSNLLSGLSTSLLKGQDKGRVNIMVVGYSADDPGHAGANLTDSIMIVSLSTSGKASYMLSIPRDLYVSIPNYGRAKINEAYQDGERDKFSESGLPAGGIGLLEKTIAESVGIRADYYTLVDYAAVRDVTNALNGITVNIQSSDERGIHDPNFPVKEGGPLTLKNGSQEIDGQTALRLTRARGAAGGSYGLALSDFDRTKNQQAVMLGIKNKLSVGLLLDPRKNKPILDGIASNVHTDVAISEALPLFRLFHSIPSEKLKPVTLRDVNGQNLLRGYGTPSGQSALIPTAGINDYSDIQAAITVLNN